MAGSRRKSHGGRLRLECAGLASCCPNPINSVPVKDPFGHVRSCVAEGTSSGQLVSWPVSFHPEHGGANPAAPGRLVWHGTRVMCSVRSWTEEVLRSTVVEEVPLEGGMSTALSVVTTASGRRAVLRQYPSPKWSPQQARRASAGEASVLTALAAAEVPAPSLLGATGDREDMAPAVLMSLCLGGRHRGDDLVIARQLGRVLAGIHAVGPVDGLADETTATVQSLRAGQPPRYGARSELLELVMRSIPRELETRPRVLVHNDFSISNVLVDGDTVSGVVDWTEAGQGNAGVDVGFAYVSTVLSFGSAAGEELLRGYRSRAASPVDDLAWWQMVAANRLEPDIDTWTSSANFLGPAHLTTAQVRNRFNVLVETAAAIVQTSAH